MNDGNAWCALCLALAVASLAGCGTPSNSLAAPEQEETRIQPLAIPLSLMPLHDEAALPRVEVVRGAYGATVFKYEYTPEMERTAERGLTQDEFAVIESRLFEARDSTITARQVAALLSEGVSESHYGIGVRSGPSGSGRQRWPVHEHEAFAEESREYGFLLKAMIVALNVDDHEDWSVNVCRRVLSDRSFDYHPSPPKRLLGEIRRLAREYLYPTVVGESTADDASE